LNWIILGLAGLAEVVSVLLLKRLNNFKLNLLTLSCMACMGLSLYLLSLSLSSIPIGTAYAIWTGIGTTGSVVFGIIIYKEQYNLKKLIYIMAIIIGIIGLRLTV
jgi:quaternary ammonium compound-resistance protein SugE